MKRVYIDTNLLLSPFRKQDPNFLLMESIRIQKHIELVTSTLSIFEMYNVLKREHKAFNREIKQIITETDLVKLQDLSKDNQMFLATEYLLNYYQIGILEDNDSDLMTIQNKGIKINPIYKLAFKIHNSNKLRSLDLLHYCYAKYFTEFKNFPIHYLITSDFTFQTAREFLKDDTSFIIISPESFIEIEC